MKYAVKLDLIPGNPADSVERPKKEKLTANFYDADEINPLFEISKGTELEIPILFGAFYGLRRSETIGLKWDAVVSAPSRPITDERVLTLCFVVGHAV